MRRSSRKTSLSRAIRLAVALGFGLYGVAQAQALPEGVRLGMTPQELQQALPGLQRVARPVRLAGGLRGSWQVPAVVAGLSGQQTFFFQGTQLLRVEFFADSRDRPESAGRAFEQILAWGRGTYGPEQGAKDPQSRYATWSLDGTEVYAQSVSAPNAALRLVYKLRQSRDASEL